MSEVVEVNVCTRNCCRFCYIVPQSLRSLALDFLLVTPPLTLLDLKLAVVFD